MNKITPIKTKTKNYENDFFVFDSETWGLSPKPDNFAFGVIYGCYNGEHKYKVLNTPDEAKKEFLRPIYKNKKIFAHNAEYDLLAVFGNIIENLDNAAIFNGKFISAKWQNVTFVDSLNVLPSSVDKLGFSLGYEKGVTPEKFINATREAVTQSDIHYCVRDCKIVYKSLLQMFNFIGGIRITIASCAMYHFRKNYLQDDLHYNDLANDFFDSYFGGRTEVFKLGHCDCEVYDINSLYPTIMYKSKFPDVEHLKKIDKISVEKFLFLLKTKAGLAKIKVRHKNTYYGYLPLKSENGKLIFPIGEFSGVWNLNEIKYAYDKGVIEILNCDYIIYSSYVDSPFKSYVHDLYNLRKNTDASDIYNFIYKILLNSLYGKFAMREKFSEVYYENYPYELINQLKNNNTFHRVKTFSINRNDCYLVTENDDLKASYFTIAAFASYITSEARIKLLDALTKHDVNYCDTDSLFVPRGTKINLTIGNELGQWKLENKNVTEIRGLKNYSGVENGIKFDAIKGIRKNSKKIAENTYITNKYIKTKEGLRRVDVNAGDNVNVIKVLKHKYDKREILKDNINTKPIKLN